MIRRARLLAVTATLAAGALGVISSTQTWLTVSLSQGSDDLLLVPGAAAIAVLAPLSLAVLALGAALSIVGLILRYAFGALTVAIATLLGWQTWVVLAQRPPEAVASTVTGVTGISGVDAVTDLIATISLTPWPAITFVGWVLLLAAGVFTLITARGWKGAGRRYRTDAAAAPHAAASPTAPLGSTAPLDAIDSWDGLSRGEDPTR